MTAQSSNQATVYESEEGKILKRVARSLGAKTTYFTKKIEFFQLANGRRFLLEPDRGCQVNLGFKPGLGPMQRHPLTTVGKNSNVKSHWGLPNNEFLKVIVSDGSVSSSISTGEAVDLLTRFAS